jgi:hypothetical protein
MRAIDLTNQRFGRLTVIRRVVNDARGQARWECRCATRSEQNKNRRLFKRGAHNVVA